MMRAYVNPVFEHIFRDFFGEVAYPSPEVPVIDFTDEDLPPKPPKDFVLEMRMDENGEYVLK